MSWGGRGCRVGDSNHWNGACCFWCNSHVKLDEQEKEDVNWEGKRIGLLGGAWKFLFSIVFLYFSSIFPFFP